MSPTDTSDSPGHDGDHKPPPPPAALAPVPPPPPEAPAPAPPPPVTDVPFSLPPELGSEPPYQPLPPGSVRPPIDQPIDQPIAEPRSPRWYRKPATLIGAGAGVIVLAAAAVLFLLYRPSFAVSAIDAPESVVSGQGVVVSVLIGNSGWSAGDHELSVLVDGDVAKTETHTVEGRSESWIDVRLDDLGPGRYTITVADIEDLSDSVWVMTPPEFVIDSIVVTPNPLDFNASHDASLLVQVSNVGEADGMHVVELMVDGVETETRALELAGGATTEESFAIAVAGPGEHEVRVEDTVATLRVNQLARPANGEALVNAIGGGSNELRIFNNSTDDLLVVLASPGPDQPALLSVYVHALSSHTVTGISDGLYSTYYAFGADWCTYAREFTRNASFGRFEEDASYTSNWSYYTYYTLEMGTTTGVGVPTVSVPEGSFPAM